jgi:hypothetical protein
MWDTHSARAAPEWSGRYENQISAKKGLELVIPVVFLIIFPLLYKIYNSLHPHHKGERFEDWLKRCSRFYIFATRN